MISKDHVVLSRCNSQIAFLQPSYLLLIVLSNLLVAISFGAPPIGDPRVAYRQFALEHDGDVERGKQLFNNQVKCQCSNCHNLTGMEKSGPNLEGIAEKFDREELIKHLLFPSEFIAPGFEQVNIVTKDGKVHVGRLERANKSICRLLDANGKQTDIPSDEIEQKQLSNISLMPDNLASVIGPQEFTDLLAYLKTLSFGVHRGFVAGGRAIEIPRLAKPVEFRAIHSPELSFENAVWCGALPSTPNDLLVIEHQTSRIWRLVRDGQPLRRELFLDLSSDVYFSGNQGLMCIAFHPNYAANRRYFLEHEVQEGGEVKTTVVERRGSDDGLRDSGQPSRRLLDVVQPAYNHNGGCIAFGPDGMLYIAFGDGGPQRDPPGYSQNPREFLGSMLRIDVDRADPGLPYGIPADNPFHEARRRDLAIRAETWAIGFREPWRYSFDPKTGELYVGDVGQDKFEEVSIVKRGENHGWNVREAFALFSDEYRRDGEKYVDPIFAYEHGLGFSVTGGHVYRGKANSSFEGVYIFGDYNTRRVWGLKQNNGTVSKVVEIGTAPKSVASFGIDQAGEIYLVGYMGTIYHIELSNSDFPQ